jgi:hypothetical protein
MNTAELSSLNQTFFQTEETKQVNENLCFNTDLLNRCRVSSPRIEKYLKKYGKLIEPELQLIELKSIHGLDPITSKKGKTMPRGFQVRSEEDLDSTVVDDLVEDILKNEWEPTAHQPVFFKLGADWEYFDNYGNKKEYGIANGNHRYTAALQSRQEFIIGWIIDIPLKYLKKWVTAEANRQLLSCKPRSDQDIIDSILYDISSEDSDLYQKIQKADNSEYEKILNEEVKDYNVSSQKANTIVRGVIHSSGLTPERKQWGSDQSVSYISEQCIDWIKIKHEIYDFETKQGSYVILVQDEGRGVQIAVDKYINHILGPNKNKNLIICFSTAKKAKIDKSNRQQIRNSFRMRFNERLMNYHEGTKLIFDNMSAIIPQYIALPEFDDEQGFVHIV